MNGIFPYQPSLLEALDSFLEGTPSAEKHGLDILDAIPSPPVFTLDDVVWGYLIPILRDFVVRENVEYLQELRHYLAGTTLVPMISYFGGNFVVYMSPPEREWYETLCKLIAHLEIFPASGGDEAEYVAHYDALKERVLDQITRLPRSAQIGEETLYRLVLYEISARVVQMDMQYSLLPQNRHLVLQAESIGGYGRQRDPAVMPDATSALHWAKKACAALSGEDALWMALHIQGNAVLFSFN